MPAPLRCLAQANSETDITPDLRVFCQRDLSISIRTSLYSSTREQVGN